MTQHAWRLPFALDPLIAEAKRRARQRRVLLVAVVLALAFGVGGATVAAHPFGWLRTSYAGPYEPGGMFIGPGGLPSPVSGAGVQAVSAASGSDAWVVGSVARRWDSHMWRNVPLPRISGADLWAVSADTPRDAWAAGWWSRGIGPYHALVEHWNGARWSVVPLPRLRVSRLYGDRPYPWSTSSMLYGISAAGPRSVWAVGSSSRLHAHRGIPRTTRPLLLHWNGSSWREWSLPWSRPGLVLDKVVATGSSSVWVISTGSQNQLRLQPRIEYWNGSRWRRVQSPFGQTDPLVGFSATAENDAWAVGSYALGGNHVAHYSHALAAHWDGARWQITPVPNPPGTANSAALIDVAAARPSDAWALGESQGFKLDGNDGLSDGTGPAAYFLHWNGQEWQTTPGATPGIYDGLPAISAAPDGSAWTIGQCYFDDFSTRWTGKAWVMAPHPRDTHWRANAPNSRPRIRPPTCPASSTPQY